jgi:predicted DNA-binding transcriptional regulator YafY
MSVKASDISFNEGVLRLAVVHHKRVEFRYAKGEGDVIETRQLQPESIKVAQGGAMSFVGWDPDRNALRTYRVDRIKGEVKFA